MQRGGTFTSQMDGVTGVSNGVVTGADNGMPAGDALRVHTGTVQETNRAPDGGPASATEMAPRREQAPHMAPKDSRIIRGAVVPKIVVTLANADVADSDSVRRHSPSR